MSIILENIKFFYVGFINLELFYRELIILICLVGIFIRLLMFRDYKKGIECIVVLFINNLNIGKFVIFLYIWNIFMVFRSLCLG